MKMVMKTELMIIGLKSSNKEFTQRVVWEQAMT